MAAPRTRTQGMNWITKKKRLAIYLRDGLTCAYCGSTLEDGAKLSLDHLKPYSKGGSNEATNLVTCCGKCNSSRQDRPWKDFTKDVSQYLLVNSEEIIAHINRCRRRKIDPAAAQKIIECRGNWSAVISNGCK